MLLIMLLTLTRPACFFFFHAFYRSTVNDTNLERLTRFQRDLETRMACYGELSKERMYIDATDTNRSDRTNDTSNDESDLSAANRKTCNTCSYNNNMESEGDRNVDLWEKYFFPFPLSRSLPLRAFIE